MMPMLVGNRQRDGLIALQVQGHGPPREYLTAESGCAAAGQSRVDGREERGWEVMVASCGGGSEPRVATAISQRTTRSVSTGGSGLSRRAEHQHVVDRSVSG
jgi:hypothetical protein